MHNYFTNITEFHNAALRNNMWKVWDKRFQNYNVDFKRNGLEIYTPK